MHYLLFHCKQAKGCHRNAGCAFASLQQLIIPSQSSSPSSSLPSIQKGSMPEWARQLPWCPHANVQWQFCWHQLSTERKEQDNTSFLIHVEFLLPLFSWLFNLFASFMWSSNQTPNDNAAVPTIALRSWLFFTWQQGSIKQHPCVVDMFWRTFSMVHVHAATANWG